MDALTGLHPALIAKSTPSRAACKWVIPGVLPDLATSAMLTSCLYGSGLLVQVSICCPFPLAGGLAEKSSGGQASTHWLGFYRS